MFYLPGGSLIAGYRQRIESAFEGLAHRIQRYRWLVIAVMAVISVFPIMQLPSLVFDTSTEVFFHEDDPIRLEYDRFLKQFDRDEFVVLLIESDNVFTRGFLKKLNALHRELEREVPHLDEVLSLVNVTHMQGDKDRLLVRDLMENIPRDRQALQVLEKTALQHPLYPDLLVSPDGRFTVIIVRARAFSQPASAGDVLAGFDDESTAAETGEKLTPRQNAAVVRSVRRIAAGYRDDDFRIDYSGMILIEDDLMSAMNRDIPRFTGAAVVLITVILFVIYRRLSGVLLPLSVVLLSLPVTLGTMAWLGVKFTVFTQILPSFLLAVGIGDSVHLLTIFYRHYRKTGDKALALQYAMGHTGLAMVMTTLTTAGGLLSFAFAEVAPIGELGVTGAMGVAIALVYSLLLLPALISVFPIGRTPLERTGRMNRMIDSMLRNLGHSAVTHPGKVVLGAVCIVAVALYGAAQLRFEHNSLSWFPADHEVRLATEKLDRHMRGSVNVELVIDSGAFDGVKTVDFMNRMDRLYDALYGLEYKHIVAGKIISVLNTLKLVHRALNEGRITFYKVPQQDDAVSQELLLFENSGGDDLERLVDRGFRLARVTIKVPWASAGEYVDYLDKVDAVMGGVFTERESYTVTGAMSLFTHTIDAAMRSMASSYVIAGAVIATLMMLLLGDIRLGLIAMIPNLFPVVVALGFMGLFGFPLDLASILVGSIAIGLSVDDTIHFMHHFRRYFGHGGQARQAVLQTLNTSGRAMLYTTVVLSSGFFIFAFSTMNNLISFGIVTGVAVLLALLADIVLAPALMVYVTRSERLCRCLR